MFWNKGNHRRITLKTRMALSYALLFFISCAIIFCLMVYLISRMLNRADDASTRLIATEIEIIYILGPRFDRFGEILPGSEYPAADRVVLERRFPGIEVCYIYRSMLHDLPDDAQSRRIYNTAFAAWRGAFYEMRVQDGSLVYSRKINVANHMARLRRYFMQQLYARGQENCYLGIFNADGSPFLTTDMLNEWTEKAAKAGDADASDASDDVSVQPAPEAAEPEFYCVDFTLPDGRTLRVGRSAKALERLRTQYTLGFFGLLTIVTAAGICVGWLISLRFIRGIRRTTLAMNRISSGDYSYRIADAADGDREIRELMETFNAMNARTEALLRELKVISDDVAHDLRTPLTRISGTVELLLRDRGLNEHIRTACASVAEEIARMRQLIDLMMDITRTNSNPEEIRKTEVDLGEMLRDFCEIMQPVIEEKHLELRLELAEGPLWIMADKTKLQRVVSNLLENALKFTERGWIKVTAKQVPGAIEMQIADSGCGISESDQPRVFERFFRCDASRNLQGNGLGLALVQAVAKAHGWRIALDSVPGEGTCFTISIPEPEKRIAGTPETPIRNEALTRP